MDRIFDPNNTQRDINDAHCHALARSIRNYNIYYAHDMVIVHFSFTVNEEGATYATPAHTLDATKLLRDSYYMVMRDGSLQRSAFNLLRERDGLK